MQDYHIRLWKKLGKCEIWVGNGKLIRDQIDPDFSEAGHHLRYQWMKPNEIVLDDERHGDEYADDAFHELYEHSKMANEGMDYDHAHDAALALEKRFRQGVYSTGKLEQEIEILMQEFEPVKFKPELVQHQLEYKIQDCVNMNEGLFAIHHQGDKEFEIYIDPSPEELMQARSKEFNAIRFIADAKHKHLYVFDAELMHASAWDRIVYTDKQIGSGNRYIHNSSDLFPGIAEYKGGKWVVTECHMLQTEEPDFDQLKKFYEQDWSWLNKYIDAEDYLEEWKAAFEQEMAAKERLKATENEPLYYNKVKDRLAKEKDAQKYQYKRQSEAMITLEQCVMINENLAQAKNYVKQEWITQHMFDAVQEFVEQHGFQKYFGWIVKQIVYRATAGRGTDTASQKMGSTGLNPQRIVQEWLDRDWDLPTVLRKFKYLAQKKKIKGEDADINTYKQVGDLKTFIDVYEETKPVFASDIKYVLETFLAEGDDYKVKFEDDGLYVLDIRTYDAMRALGAPTWCVYKDKNTFNDYLSRGPFLIVRDEKAEHTADAILGVGWGEGKYDGTDITADYQINDGLNHTANWDNMRIHDYVSFNEMQDMCPIDQDYHGRLITEYEESEDYQEDMDDLKYDVRRDLEQFGIDRNTGEGTYGEIGAAMIGTERLNASIGALDEYVGTDDLEVLFRTIGLPTGDVGVLWANLADQFHSFPTYKRTYRTLYTVWDNTWQELNMLDELKQLMDAYEWNTKDPFVKNVFAEIETEVAIENDFERALKKAVQDSIDLGIDTKAISARTNTEEANDVTDLYKLMIAYHRPVFGTSLTTFENKLTSLGYRESDKQLLLKAYDDILKHKQTSPGQQFMFGERVYRIQDVTQWLKEAEERTYTVDSLFESRASAYAKYVDTGLITASDFEEMLDLDPLKDTTAKYIEWIIRMYKASTHLPQMSLVKQALKDYEYASKKNLISGKDRNIANFKSFDELIKFMDKVDVVSVEGGGKSKIDLTGLKDKVDYAIIDKNAKSIIIQLLSHKGAKKLCPSSYCIAKDDPYDWENYVENDVYSILVYDFTQMESNTNRVWGWALHKGGEVHVSDGINKEQHWNSGYAMLERLGYDPYEITHDNIPVYAKNVNEATQYIKESEIWNRIIHDAVIEGKAKMNFDGIPYTALKFLKEMGRLEAYIVAHPEHKAAVNTFCNMEEMEA